MWGQKLLIVAKIETKHGFVQLKYFPVILKNHANTLGKRHDKKPLVQSKYGGHWSTKTTEHRSLHPTYETILHRQKDSSVSFLLQLLTLTFWISKMYHNRDSSWLHVAKRLQQKDTQSFLKDVGSGSFEHQLEWEPLFLLNLLSPLPILRCICLILTSPFCLK